MKAIILAGGFGTRLQSVVSDVPKPMADISGRPFLEILLNYLESQGVDEFIFSVHYKADKIIEYFSKEKFSKFNISFIKEEKPLGTGGAIKYILANINHENQSLLVLNGDTFVKTSYQKLIETHKNGDSKLTMLLREIDDISRYGEAIISNRKIIKFSAENKSGKGLINAGVYVIEPDIFEGFEMGQEFSFERDFIEKYTEKISPNFNISEQYFIDIGIPKDYKKAQIELANL